MNTDVRHEGRVFHIQTEDRVSDAPRLVSQVYISGQILRTVETPYEPGPARDEEEIRERLKKQHRLLIAAVLRGKITAGEAPSAAPARERPALVVTPLADLRAGEPADLLILLRGDRTFRPVVDAPLSITLETGEGDPVAVHAGRTDGKGFHLAELRVPDSDAPELSLVVDAGSGKEDAKAVLPVLPKRGTALAPGAATERPGLIVSDIEPPRRGAAASLMILVRREPSTRPIPGARLRLLVVWDEENAIELAAAKTDRRGFHLADVKIPPDAADGASLLIEATTELGVAETLIPIAPR